MNWVDSKLYNSFADEGRVFLNYVLQAEPEPYLVKRYTEALHKVNAHQPLDLPVFIRRFPSLLRFVEPLGKGRTLHQKELVKRIQYAVSLAETDPSGAVTFCQTKHNNIVVTLISISVVVFTEMLVLPFRLINTFLGK